ncbi:MAG: TRAP transporter small permease subunit [Stappiaceae bacterium]
MIAFRDIKPKGAFQSALLAADRFTWGLGGVFQWICNICLLVMLGLTAVTIVGRPFGFSAYWIWPWTMVFFVWLSFFGFFAIFVRLKDVRIDFLANHMGRYGYPITRLVSDLSALAICGVLIQQMPTVLATSRGFVDGAILPGGDELFRQALSIPLFISAALIMVSALVDLCKMLVGLPENITEHHPEI